MSILRKLNEKPLAVWLSLYGLFAIAATLQSLFTGPVVFDGTQYSQLENYHIFRNSFFHLLQNKNLYASYPQLQWDLFKYSPSFAFFMGIFAGLPLGAGLLLWNLANSLPFCLAVWLLPKIPQKARIWILAFCILELLTSMQNSQSNGLVAALMLGAFIGLDRRRFVWAGLFMALGFYVKIFGIFSVLFILLFPGKIRASLWFGFWMIVIWIVPVLGISPSLLTGQYGHWMELLAQDRAISSGLSVMGWLQSWFGFHGNPNWITGGGILLLLFPLFQMRKLQEPHFRNLYLSFVLIWVVIFNHRAESPTFVIAVCGTAISYFSQEKNRIRMIVTLSVFILTILSPTEIFPKFLRERFVFPYTLKAVPCIAVWGMLWIQLVTGKYKRSTGETDLPEIKRANPT